MIGSLPGAHVAYAHMIAALPLAFLPLAFSTGGEGLSALAYLALGLSAMLGGTVLLRTPFFPRVPAVALSVAPLLALTAVSSIGGKDSLAILFFGKGSEPHTVFLFLCFAAALCFGAAARESAPRVLGLFVLSSCTLGLSLIVARAFGVLFEPVAWTVASHALLGGVCVSAYFVDTSSPRKKTYTAALVLSVALAAYVAPPAALFSAGGALLCAAALRFFLTRQISLAAVGVACLLIVFGLFAPLQNGPTLEIRPSWDATATVVGSAFFSSAERVFWGSGLNTFDRLWELHRIPEVNSTSFWNVTPRAGFSTMATLSGEMGALSIPALALPFLFAFLFVRRSQEERDSVLSACAALTAFVFALSFFDVLTAPVFLFAGVALGFLHGPLAGIAHSERIRPVTLALSACVLVFGVWMTQASVRQVVAARLYERAMTSADWKERAGAWSDAFYEREASRAYLSAARESIERNASPSDIRALLERGAVFADAAGESDNAGYAAWLHRAEFYTAAGAFGYPDAISRAEESFKLALQFAPLRPDVYLRIASFEAYRGNIRKAREALEHALSLKPDYAEAAAALRELP
jgi:hypothetical protein